MKSLCERLKELSLGDVVGILGLLIVAADFLYDLIFQGVLKNELPRFLFSLCFLASCFRGQQSVYPLTDNGEGREAGMKGSVMSCLIAMTEMMLRVDNVQS